MKKLLPLIFLLSSSVIAEPLKLLCVGEARALYGYTDRIYEVNTFLILEDITNCIKGDCGKENIFILPKFVYSEYSKMQKIWPKPISVCKENKEEYCIPIVDLEITDSLISGYTRIGFPLKKKRKITVNRVSGIINYNGGSLVTMSGDCDIEAESKPKKF